MERRKRRRYCPAGVPLATREEVATAQPDTTLPPIKNSLGENVLPTTVLGKGEVVNPNGKCGFETVGEKFNSAGWDVGACTFCLALCLVRSGQE